MFSRSFQLAEFRGDAWTFKLPPDNDFIARFPGVCQDSLSRFNKESIRALYDKITCISNAQKQTAADKDNKKVSGTAASSSTASSSEVLGEQKGRLQLMHLSRASRSRSVHSSHIRNDTVSMKGLRIPPQSWIIDLSLHSWIDVEI